MTSAKAARARSYAGRSRAVSISEVATVVLSPEESLDLSENVALHPQCTYKTLVKTLLLYLNQRKTPVTKINLLNFALITLSGLVSGCGSDGLCVNSKSCILRDYLLTVVDKQDLRIKPGGSYTSSFELPQRSTVTFNVSTQQGDSLDFSIMTNDDWNKYMTKTFTGDFFKVTYGKFISTAKLEAFEKDGTAITYALPFFCKNTPLPMIDSSCIVSVTVTAKTELITLK